MDAAFTTGISYTSEKINKQCKNSLRLLLKKTIYILNVYSS